MTDHDDDLDNEAPLDPAMENMRKRLARLLVISIGTMMIGLMAVLGAVVYKAGGTATPSTITRKTLQIPEGFVVSDTAISDNRILLYGEAAEGGMRILIYDTGSAALVAEHKVQ